MNNVNLNIHSPHGVGALHSDATAPVVTTKAEKSARAFKALADRNRGQVQFLELAWPQTVAGNTGFNLGGF